jgi:hypothetical protein
MNASTDTLLDDCPIITHYELDSMPTKPLLWTTAGLLLICGISSLATTIPHTIVDTGTERGERFVSGAQLGTIMSPLFSRVQIGTSLETLPDNEQRALVAIIAAAEIMDAIFLEQVWAGNPATLLELAGDTTARGQARLDFFLINKGPWSRLQNNQRFVPGVPPKPKGANYYPIDATRDEIEQWFNGLSGDRRAAATSSLTAIRRGADGQLMTVPYSLEYQGALATAAVHLREAAQLTAEPTLRRYLELRAEAFVTNDYYESDVAWMELDSAIEPTIGPYEVYEDEWFNYKAAFEAFVTIRDETETAQLERFSGYLQELEDNLPIDADFRNPELGDLAPIRVVNVVFTAGDANSGVQASAFNLPNDERLVRNYGSKRVMLKNIQEAKFLTVLSRIADVALSRADRQDVSFDAFFTHILMHELMHGLGPHTIVVDGTETTTRQQLRDTYSTIEEAKADISGLWALHRLVDSGAVDRSLERSIHTTFLASTFRSIRFGINEAHGRAVAIQLNTFLDTGAVIADPGGTFSVDHTKIRKTVQDLTRRLMMLQARGDYAAAQDIMNTLGVVRPAVQDVLDRLQSIPIDIEPHFMTAETLTQP